jgi:parallel beta-helix repeat protein
MNECGLLIYGSFAEMSSHSIDTTNLVNGKPLYYYTNEISLGSDNFTNAGQVILVNCSDSLISNLDLSNGTCGILLGYSNNNNVSGNTANYNSYGIYLRDSNDNTVSENTVNYNDDYGAWSNGYGIYLRDSNDNNVSGNTANYNDVVGIHLMNSNYNNVSVNTVNCNHDGIELEGSNDNTVSGNTANNNSYGIYLRDSNDNTISGNAIIYIISCIVEEICEGNIIENNDCQEYVPEYGDIPGYSLYILIGTIAVISAILIKKRIK